MKTITYTQLVECDHDSPTLRVIWNLPKRDGQDCDPATVPTQPKTGSDIGFPYAIVAMKEAAEKRGWRCRITSETAVDEGTTGAWLWDEVTLVCSK